MKNWIGLLLSGLLLAACASLSPGREPAPVAWMQFGLGDQPELIARALIGRGDDCPSIAVDGQVSSMAERPSPRAAIFGRVCERRLTLESSRRIRITARNTVLLDQEISRNPQRVAVFGDTGCRITNYVDQGCNDPAKWPFAQVAASVVAKNPDLVLHVGDYYYREAPCVRTSTDCVPSPYGDREETWRVEFFTPAAALLAKAPWVFVRGNHEDCARGGYGWTYYFGDTDQACQIVHTPARIDLAGLTLLNVDSAHTDDKFARAEINAYWNDLAQKLREAPLPGASPLFILTHEPGYAVCPGGCKAEESADTGGLRTIADAVRGAGRRTILLTGHIHTFEAVDVAPVTLGGGRGVTQMIVGTGGSSLDKFGGTDAAKQIVSTYEDVRFEKVGSDKWQPVRKGRVSLRAQMWNRFGFGMLSPGALELVMYDAEGARQFACGLAEERTVERCR
jgi:Calcineurin-like phosphoesterase